MRCPACHGRGFESAWRPKHARDSRYVAINDQCRRCEGVGHVPVPSERELRAIAVRCAFGPAGGHRDGVLDPETGKLKPGCYQGAYSDDGVYVDWMAGKVLLRAYANTPPSTYPWRDPEDDRVGPLVEYAEPGDGPGIAGGVPPRVVLEKTYRWQQLLQDAPDDNEQLELALGAT